MKEQFNNVGFSRVETRLMSLSTSDRRLETDYLRSDPVSWIDENFILSPRQKGQLQSMDLIFLKRIANGVSDSWDQGQLVSFYKENRSEGDEEEKSPKDILFSGQRSQSMTFGEEPTSEIQQVGIWIRYR